MSSKKARTLARYVKENPNDSFSKFALALEFLKEDQLKKARVLFESIAKNDPEYVGVYYHLGKLYERLDRNDLALQTYTKGIEVAKSQNDAHTADEITEAMQLMDD